MFGRQALRNFGEKEDGLFIPVNDATDTMVDAGTIQHKIKKASHVHFQAHRTPATL